MNRQRGNNKGHNRVPGLCPSDQLAVQAARANAQRPQGSMPVGISEPEPKKRKKRHR